MSRRVVRFVDGQNLFYAAKNAFGHRHPKYDVRALSAGLCADQDWRLDQTRFYTGVPDSADNAFWNHFWTAKLAQMGREGLHVFSRPLRYRNQTVRLPDGQVHTFLVGQEKGVDVRLALDIVALAYENVLDVALVLSQDQDLSEVAQEIRKIANSQKRWIKMACAFPSSPASTNRRGINGADWIRIDRARYDRCLDTRDYRPKMPPMP